MNFYRFLLSELIIMQINAVSTVRVGYKCSDDFNEKAGVHQVSSLNPLLFTIVMDALHQEFRDDCPWDFVC